MFFLNGNFYTISIILQAICVIHCVRKGNQNKWIWLIIFLPILGSLIYIFTEMFSGRDLKDVQSNVGNVLNPSGRVKKLEENFRFSDTFQNRIALADRYLSDGLTEKAIELYESGLTGNFIDNEHVLRQLILAYFQIKSYDEVITLSKKLYTRPQFARSKSHVLYAMALDLTGNPELSEKEFSMMQGKFSNFEARYQFGMFLNRNSRDEEARDVFKEITNEARHLSNVELRDNRQWLNAAKDQYSRLSVPSK